MLDSAAQPAPIRVLVVDDQRLMRDGIASLLSIQDGIEVVGAAADGQEALEQALALQPDVILMDVRMPHMDGVEATVQICRQLPACRVLMLTTFDDEEYIVDALRAGASGYLLKNIPSPDLAKAIQAVHTNIYQFDPTVAGKVVASLTRPQASQAQTAAAGTAADRARTLDLTEREIEVLRLIARGATNREIAQGLVISEGTVKNHISSILSRLGLRDRTQAAIYAREQGLL
ncbi:response regulator transcription factor [Ktedonosporobacter rubrisoli]|uniref:Response regulator transcription factor n=1 Tax=Ktedonosporobacter rubrisoli TaxID=2509675 RepID=A0A4P6JVC1_KTERU|nr:response regulator transcription factor [Ktedonosporobacter rubrisoli]QBD79280.1 response regulator transcription factor [Ktedonosporobacter rubrisoli]